MSKHAHAVRFGVNSNPPMIVVEYRKAQGSKLRRKLVRFNNLGICPTDAAKLAERLARKFPNHFGGNVVNPSQLAGLLEKLLRSLPSPSNTSKRDEIGGKARLSGKDTATTEDVAETEDLNRASEAALAAAKARMDEKFKQNLLTPDSSGYEHDRRVDFGEPDVDNDWDDTSSDTVL